MRLEDDHVLVPLTNLFPLSPVDFFTRLREWMNRRCPWVLQGCAIPYRMVTGLRRMGYHRGWFPLHRLPKPVISIGNLTVGGTGKTPFVMWLASRLHQRGKRVAILTRGYGRQNSSEYRLVSDGTGLKTDWRDVGDEAVLLAQKCPWAIVAVGRDRFKLGRWVLEHTACDCFLLDDGFQHVSLYRDKDILLFDATDMEGLGEVLPAGRMRESLSAARWATTIVFTRTEQMSSFESLREKIQSYVRKPIAPVRMKTVPRWLVHLPTGTTQQIDFFLQKSLLLFSGIGNPASLRSNVMSWGLEARDEIRYPDHYAYSAHDVEDIRLRMIRSMCPIALTTEKDGVKLKEFLKKEDQIWALDVQMTVTQGEAEIRKLLDDVCG